MTTGEELILGIDIGGTKIAAGLVEGASGAILREKTVPTPAGGNRPLLDALRGLIADLAGPDGPATAGIGIGVPGTVDRRRGIALRASNLDFSDLPLRGELAGDSRGPVYVENDANTGALGEKWYGRGRGLKDLVYLTIGTGIGGGLILDGSLYHGMGRAGEVGHIISDPGGFRCVCGMRGCLEAQASGPAIARRATQRLREGAGGRLWEGWNEGGEITGRDVARAAREGDELALGVFKEAGRHLALVCSGLYNLLDPAAIILGGGVSRAGSLLTDAIRDGAPTAGMRRTLESILCLAGVTSGIAGAAALVAEYENQGQGGMGW